MTDHEIRAAELERKLAEAELARDRLKVAVASLTGQVEAWQEKAKRYEAALRLLGEVAK